MNSTLLHKTAMWPLRRICLLVALLISAADVRAGLVHRYPFTSGAQDTVGGAHGALVGGATITGGAVVLDGSSGYVDLPNGLVAGLTSISVEAWVTDQGSGPWARIYDFGNSDAGEDFAIGSSSVGTEYMFLSTPSGMGTLRGSYTVGGGGAAEQVVEWPGRALPVGERKHVLWTSDSGAQTAWLYVDGVLVASNSGVTLTPASLGGTVNNWIGRSQYADPLFLGSVSEFRIYDTALSPLQAAVNTAGGPDQVVTDPGPIQTLALTLNATLFVGSSQAASVTASFQNVSGVNLGGVPGVAYVSSDTNVAAVSAAGVVTARNPGVATITASYQGASDAESVQVLPQPQTMLHRYSFAADASDSVGDAHGTLEGDASVSGGAAQFNGTTAYVNLPNDLVSGLESVTFEMWYTDTGSSTWARLWDFGNSALGEDRQGGGTSYLFFCVPSNSGGVRGAYKLPGLPEQLIDYGSRPSLNTQHHVVWTQDALSHTARLYVDGVQVAENTGFTYTPAGIGTMVNDWLGRSQYNDPYFKGSISEFRIYGAAITAAEVQQNYNLGPDVSPQDGPVAITVQPAAASTPEQQPVSFSVGYTGQRPVAMQWYRNATRIPGATNPVYYLSSPLPTDSGASFSVRLTNVVNSQTYFAISTGAALTVVPDTTAPMIVRGLSTGATNVQIVFSERLETAAATNAGNYVFANGVPVSRAQLSADGVTVLLTVPPLVYGSNYTVRVSGVRDRAYDPNTIAPNSPVSFIASPYSPYDIGGSLPAGYIAGAGSGFDLTAGGGSLGGAADQCNFSYQTYTGDFDIQVRLQGLTAITPSTKAGLMARETLDAGSRFAAAIATPQLKGSFFQYRAAASAVAASTGYFPANLPDGWLRLQRVGPVLNGYASFDGQTWVLLGSANLAFPTSIYVGMVLASDANGTPATAQFRDLGNTASQATGSLDAAFEPLGPSSRRTPVVVSEIMYKPAARADGRDLEFIELFNSNPWPEDIGGWKIKGDVDFTFPPGTQIPGGGFAVVAAAPADIQAVYGLTGVYGPYTNRLPTSGAVKVYDEAHALLLEVDYNDESPWPAAASGAGHSLVLARPSYGEADPQAWDISDRAGGSPGANDSFRPSPLRNVAINEVLAHTDSPDLDAIELYNHSNTAVDLAGCVLTDDPATNRFVFASPTMIGARGFVYLTQAELGFALNAAGETIYFKNPAGTRVLDALAFGAQENGVSFGRYPDGSKEWHRLGSRTFGSANAAPRVNPVGLNEIMYHPISGADQDQYVELHNRGAGAVSLAGWRLGDGISYVFPSNAVIAPNGYVVVGADVGRLRLNYPQLNATNSFGNFSGRLSGRGERITLAKPDTIVSTNSGGLALTNYIDIVVDEVTYGTGGRWGQWADGGGSSLELIDARADKRQAPSWADSDESAKAPWVNIESTGVLDHGANYDPNIGYAQIGLLEAGECLVDNIEIRPASSGANLAGNPGFDQGLTGWSLQGNHSRSSIEAGAGYPSGGAALRLRASDAVFTGANAAQVALTDTSLAPGQTATLRFKARWQRGVPEVLLRLNGNWLEAVGRLAVPANLGTPGLVNSRAAGNAGPAIFDVSHSPSLPAAGQAVTVTARVSDPDGVASFKLRYRVDPASSYTEANLIDTGTGADAIANDGVYSASIPGQGAGTVVAFVLTAGDSRGASSRFPALLNNNAPDRECVVVFGDPNPASVFGAYHLWLTQTNVDRWVSLPVLSNEEVDATLVAGSRVIYNASARYAGSPYHQAYNSPYGNACHYHWTIPKDDLFLGASSLNKIHWPGNDIQDDTPTQNNNDPTLQRGQAANYFLRALGVPWVNRRYVAVYVNGRRRGTLMEDAQRPSVSVGKQYFAGDDGGVLYKVQPWFEFGPNPSGNYMPWQNKAWATILPYKTTGGAYKTARYRWNWQLRQSPDSLNDYTNLFALLDAASASAQPGYVAAMENVADMENWMRLVAANHAVGNWDCLGVQNGQNVYGYVSPQVRWTFFMFDLDIVLGNRISWGPGANLNGFYGNDANWSAIYDTPAFGRMYWRALKELANGTMLAAAFDPRVDAKYAAIRGDGFNIQDPAAIKSWVAQARTSIAGQVASRDAAFTVGNTDVTAANNAVTLSGTAPLETVSFLVNGKSWKPTWTSLTGWTLSLPAPNGVSNWSVQPIDRLGNALGAAIPVRVTNPAVPESPVGNVVFNEILFSPTVAGAEFVELYNRSASTTFDLSGWQVNGLSYTFPAGSVLKPGGYLALARSGTAFALAYGALTPVFDWFDGNLQGDGETLSLVIPGVPPGADVLVDRVRYEAVAPWPGSMSLPGRSLQLVDAAQDNSRAGNWALGPITAPPVTPQWVYSTVTANATSSRLYMYLASTGDIYLDDLKIVAGTVPESGPNLVVNGDFESPLNGTWTLAPDFAQSTLSTAIKRSGNSSLHMVATAPGGGANDSVYKEIAPALTNGSPYTLSFWYLQTTNGGPLLVRLSGATTGSGIYVSVNPAPPAAVAGPATPGLANATAGALPPFPTVWLNEVQPVNLTGLSDNFNERDPWVEIYNPGPAAQSLAGLYLGTNYASPLLWAFPSTSSVPAGQFLTVWCDAQPAQSAGASLHAGFKLLPGTGSIVLSRVVGTNAQTVDYLNYTALPPNYSYGDVPDGQPFYRRAMYAATPGRTNDSAPAPITVHINEWMADNKGYLLDPATGGYDDWFELYNPLDTAAELGGYYLTDAVTNRFQFQIPAGYRVPARGYLLVWADNKTSANTNTSSDLHVPFKLDKGGEEIGLFAPDGRAIDVVQFQAQIENATEGRYPDGGGGVRLFMPTPSPRGPNVLPPAPAAPSVVGFVLLPGNQCSLTFATSPGHTYRVEYKSDLNEAAWQRLGTDVFAVQTESSVLDSVEAAGQRYYRIVQLD